MSETDTMTEIENAILALDASLGCLKNKEKGLVRHLAYSGSVDPNFSKAPRPDISQPSEAMEEITVRGGLIRVLCGWVGAGNLGGNAIIALAGAYVPDPIELNHMRIQRALLFHNCVFGDKVSMMHAECPALYMSGCHLHKDLNASGIKIKGSVFLREGFVAKGRVTLSVANIGGELDCTNGKFSKSQPDVSDKQMQSFEHYAIAAGGIRVGSRVKLGGHGFLANGMVELTGANIGGDLICNGGTFKNHGGVAIAAERIKTDSDIRMSSGFRAEGEVLLLGARIGGILDCAGGEFINPCGKNAINAGSMETKGHVYLNQHPLDGPQPAFMANGKVRLAGANIGGNLNCKGGMFDRGEQNFAISASGLKTRGAVIFSDGFSIKGDVQLHVAQIGGNFVCAKHAKPQKNLEGVSEPMIFASDETTPSPRSIIDLESAKAVAVQDDRWACEKYSFCLNGFSYGGFFGDNSPKNAEQRLKWLDNQPKNRDFSPLPYEQVAKVLFGMGHDNEAREILLEKESIRMRQEEESDEIFSPVSHDAVANILFAMGRNRDAREILLKKEQLLTKRGDFPWKWRWGRKIWGALAGYGYRPWWRTFVISLVIIGIGSGLFCWGEHAGKIAPHQPAALVSMKYQYGRIPAETPDETVARKFSGYPEFSPILFSVDIFVPLLNLHQEPFWYPAPYGGHQHWWGSAEDEEFSWWVLLEVWYWFQIMVGGVLTSFFLLSIAQLLRPRQSSSEKD